MDQKRWRHGRRYCTISTRGDLNTSEHHTETLNLEKQDFCRCLQFNYFEKNIKITEDLGAALINVFIINGKTKTKL